MANITVTLTGFKELEDRIAAIGARSPQVIATACYELGQVIMADSVTNYVPKDTGTLANSGRVDLPVTKDGGVSVTLGYGGPAASYAIAVHENPRAGKTMGLSPSGRKYLSWARTGQWKYLETPLKMHAPELGESLAQALNRLHQSKAN